MKSGLCEVCSKRKATRRKHCEACYLQLVARLVKLVDGWKYAESLN
jgi:hypothetical protein